MCVMHGILTCIVDSCTTFQLFQVVESNELNAALTSLKLKFASFETERREINELRSAHTSQNQLLQKLQDKVTMELQI